MVDSNFIAQMDDTKDLSIRVVIGGFLVRYWAGTTKDKDEDGDDCYINVYQEQLFVTPDELAAFVTTYCDRLQAIRNEAMAQRPLITNVMAGTFDGEKLHQIIPPKPLQ